MAQTVNVNFRLDEDVKKSMEQKMAGYKTKPVLGYRQTRTAERKSCRLVYAVEESRF